jgi:feruloyl esterase
LTDPRKCDWKPSNLRCTSQGQTNCLNNAQVRAATAIYDGPRDPVTNKLIFPGNPKGSESASSFGWNANQVGLGAEPNFDSLFKWVFGPTWTYNDFDFHDDMKSMDEVLAHLLNATDPNLDRYRDRGSKLLLYHGWADSLAASQTSIDYFTNVVKRTGGGKYTAAAQTETQDYFRLFMVPGMNHCFGGPGAMVFGNQNAGNAGQDDVPTDDKKHHALLALVDWVENGSAPEQIIATKYVGDLPGNGIAFQRPLCVYPKVPTYRGTGDVKLATSYRCVHY